MMMVMRQRDRKSIVDGKGAISNNSSSHHYAPAKKNINSDNKETIVNDNTNDITIDFLRAFSKSRLIIELWNKLPNRNEESISYEELAEKLDTNKSALFPHLRILTELKLIKCIEKPIKQFSKVNRNYYKKNGRIIVNHS